MTDNALSTLPQAETPPPEIAPVETPPAVTGENAPAPDTAPDPAKLKAEIEELEKKRKQAEEDAIYWRKQKAEARGEFFRTGAENHNSLPRRHRNRLQSLSRATSMITALMSKP